LSNLIYPLTIKIGSIAPARSPWNKALRELGREWKRITQGLVKIKIYPGGIAGNEEDMIRKMRVGILGGAGLSNRGLSSIYRDAYVLNIPYMLSTDEELDFILKKLKPVFEKEIEKKGFKVVIWTVAGWINWFTKHSVITPDDMKKHKISFTTSAPQMEQAWKKAGFHVIPNDLKDLMMALQSGMVNAFYLPPIVAASGQYFPHAPNMCSLRIAPLLGGIVMTQKVWKRIPSKYHKEMIDVTYRLSERLYKKTIELEKEAIDTMKEHGLVINQVPPESLNEWRAASSKGMNELIGKAFSKEIYNQLLTLLEEYHRLHGSKKNN
jgi:TRAP-type C4-dicarboxylate transport system substrate-binding protein